MVFFGKELREMSWLYTLLAVLTGYFILIMLNIFLLVKSKLAGNKVTLLLLVKNAERLAEAVVWDLFRLKSWSNYNFDFIVIDCGSQDDTRTILNLLRRRHPFQLITIPAFTPRRSPGVLSSSNIKTVVITGMDSPRMVRKEILFILNRSCYGEKEKASERSMEN